MIVYQIRKAGFVCVAFFILFGMLGGYAIAESGLSPMPSDEEIAAVKAGVQSLPEPLRLEFEERFAAWKRTWREPQIAVRSNPEAVTDSGEFHHLIALGNVIIPAVAGKLIEPDNFFALQLYDRLQDDPRLVLSSPEDAYDGEQARAGKTIALYARSLR
jgi:hypothetical protein